ncbi:fimbria/pilus outer membrane usher protein [Pseudomonas mosselii]|uniref:Fimbrial biogenesis outer membrane usher protein n=1 Tax=Pseudomonas mosselii TaxID=78327 RepID=A0AA42RU85_9PSED|nr:fimbrial biogenesis outer membrane usher protein [Pseudomonas mosselii]MDH1629565.1 fimbrial biogenesis outer membrane usher protein [Pseudomonas mosselii]
MSGRTKKIRLIGYVVGSCASALGGILPELAFSLEFNEAFLNKQGAAVELKYFEQGNSISPGTYNVDIYLNQVLMSRQQVEFIADHDAAGVRPKLYLGVLKGMGVNIARLKQEKLLAAEADDSLPIDLAGIVPEASVEFDVNALALQLSVPQAYMQRTSRGYVDPSLWDQGITAFYTNYQANFSRNINQGFRNDYKYIGLRSGLNIGAWRLRNDASISGSSENKLKFSRNRSYIERDITALKGRLAAGELYSQGDIFDSVRFRGAQLGSDLGMLPDNEVGYAPVVRGIAESNATVEVSQNGYVIYSTTVSPGAFEITDIYPSGSNGDLKVKIIEADGREREFSQAYSYLPVMTRRGSARYNLAVGEYDSEGKASPKFTQGTLVYGVSDNLTGYGGLLAANGYKALNLGVGINSALGGLSFDVTQSNSKASNGSSAKGQSARFLYSKTLNSTDTTFTMVGYRYSTEGYRTFSQHVDEQDVLMGSNYGRQKSRFDMNINQSLAGNGSLFLSLGETSYWNRQGNTRRWQFGYNGNYRDASYSFAVSRTEGQGMSQGADNQFTASLSIPFGGSSRSQRSYTSVTSSSTGDSSVQTGLSGNLDERNTLNYSVQAGHSKRGGTTGDLGLNWDAPIAKINGGYGQGPRSKHMDLGASGSVVVHGNGVTLGQPVGETFALVEVPGVKGVGVDSSSSVRTDNRGYAVVPYTQPYRYNWINLETESLGAGTEIEESSKVVVPTRGAITKSRFSATQGRRLQFALTRDNGQKLPFGAQAFDESGVPLGVVDNQSRLLVFGVKDSGKIVVRWSNTACVVRYELPAVEGNPVYERFELTCSVTS